MDSDTLVFCEARPIDLLSLVRLVEEGGIPQTQAVCVVSKARAPARRGKAFRVEALAVHKELRGRWLAAKAMRRLQGELGWVAGSDYKLVVDMAAHMEKEGVGPYARQGWAGGDGVWGWDSSTPVSPGSQSRGSKRQLGEQRVEVGCEAGWRMEKRRRRGSSN